MHKQKSPEDPFYRCSSQGTDNQSKTILRKKPPVVNLAKGKLKDMKTRILFFMVMLISSFTSAGQGMWVPNTISTPRGNVTINSYQAMPNMYNMNPKISFKYDFRVVMRDDSTFTRRMAIDVSGNPHQFKIKNGRQKDFIRPSDTREVSRLTLEGMLIKGVPADSCWLFHSVKGKINCYGFLAEEGYAYLAAIQEGDDGVLVPITRANVKEMVQTEDKKILALIDRGKLVKALQKYNEAK